MPIALPAEATSAFLYAFSMLGVAVFAASGALAAARKNLDLIGVAVLAMVTATGGGTVRDVLIGRTVFWIADPNHIWVSLLATAVTIAWVRYFQPPYRALLYADAIGLSFFAIIGAQIAETAGLPALVIVLMGTITGTAGGLLRDVLSVEVPLVFRKSELYVSTCIVGISVYVLLRWLGLAEAAAGSAGAAVILALRLSAIHWGWMLPVVSLGKDKPEDR
ncbi:MAG: trimeric intracellular cation channel family protein [Rhodospirillaceae bacterium]|nr:trimeric intracellular cation channel family protein [Rhodospirillaceae bacterium]